MAINQVIHLPDGRSLGFDDVGRHDGTPVIYVHGSPDSRRARHPDDSLAAALGIRLIALDRPGSGLSTPDRTGTVGSFADDALELVNHLGLEACSVLAWSAGAPYGLALAARHPDRVHTVAVVAGLVPFGAYATPGLLDDADGGRLMVAELGADLGPRAMAEMAAPMLAPYPCDLELAMEHVRAGADPVRAAELDSVPGAWEAMASGVVDSVACGLNGLVRDLELQVEEPDVDFRTVEARVDLWYAERDTTAPPAFGWWWNDVLPRSNLRVVPGAGHAVALTHWAEILQRLVEP